MADVKVVKKAAVKKAPKVVKVENTAEVAVAKKTTAPKIKTANAFTVDVFGVDGKVTGQQVMPEAIFGVKMNKVLVSQAVRVYLANQRQGNASTKSRGEVTGSTRKIYRQKGTGRARHGGITAPIFVGGGVAHGPKPHDFSLDMPQKMKQKALACVLSAKLKDGEIKVVTGFEKIEVKTKVMVASLNSLGLRAKDTNPKVLIVITDGMQSVVRATRNIERVTMTSTNRLNVYDVMTAKQIVFMKESLPAFEQRFSKEK